MLGKLYTLPEYKVLDKHINNTILLMQNKYFMTATTLEEFKAIQLMREALRTIQSTVARANKMQINQDKDAKKKQWEQETASDDLGEVEDLTPKI